ncbi:NUDIX hydrolase [Fibrella aestuarina BUZ 2]|uniref:NUDIX hydrolase n=1 Tax=Fibrella aestuarina BUZ 2 TaxID=1166018 RepID=I0K973_9BACT|nr:NUDIX hydrolase [Fibrella aestuarina]CCH00676.1 NUDIX hydrolase [Fibrella aestuarina BUZ 2]
MKVRPAVVLRQNDSVLLMHYRYGDTDVFALPGGNPDPGEDLEATLERELEEELGISIQVSQLLFCGVVNNGGRREDVLHCVFMGDWLGGDPALNPEHTTARAIVWQPLDTLPDLNLYPNVGEAILDYHAALLPTAYLGYIDQPFF